MARNPDQLHVLEAAQRFARVGDKTLQARNLRAFRSAHIAQRDIAVAAQHQSSRSGFRSHFERRAQGMQLGLVIAAGYSQQPGFFAALPVGRKQQDADADLARIGQGGTVEPGLPAIGGVDRNPGIQNKLATTKRSRAASFSRPFTTSSEAPHFMMCARKVVSACDSA